MAYRTAPVRVPQLQTKLLLELDNIQIDEQNRRLFEHGVQIALDDPRREQRLAQVCIRECNVWICWRNSTLLATGQRKWKRCYEPDLPPLSIASMPVAR